MIINHLDLFSGIGGFAVGLRNAGFDIKRHCFSEIDKHAIAIYKKQFKEAEYAGAVESIRGGEIRKSESEKWIVTFGSPCQDLSIAGKRKGMEGSRSSLFYEATRIIRELKPDYFIWENVKGAYSSNGGLDFVAVLREIAQIGGYGCTWELCNTRWFLPQNRERIYLVGCLGGLGKRKIFPVGEGIREVDEKCIQERLGADITPLWNTAMPEKSRRNIASSYTIRDLTPIEYERGQGFPDNWTAGGIYNGVEKSVSDIKRYKCCGNAVTTNVVKAIAKNLK